MQPKKTGVYLWTNTTNGKVYVGSAAGSIVHRERVHRSSLRGGYHQNKHFQAAWNKYGEAAFAYCVLELCPPEKCVEREQHWIDHYKSADPKNGYNNSPTAGNCLGCKQSPEANAKRSAAMKGRPLTVEHRAALSAGRKGMKFSPSHCAAIGRSKAGRQLTPEHKAKLSAKNKGRKFSPEQRTRWRSWNKGKKLSEEHRAKLCAARQGRVFTAETRAKMSASGKARKDFRGEGHPLSRLTTEEVLEIKRKLAAGIPQKRIADEYRVHQCVISRIHSGKRWAHVRLSEAENV
jgi:group I intron endonuclease